MSGTEWTNDRPFEGLTLTELEIATDYLERQASFIRHTIGDVGLPFAIFCENTAKENRKVIRKGRERQEFGRIIAENFMEGKE